MSTGWIPAAILAIAMGLVALHVVPVAVAFFGAVVGCGAGGGVEVAADALVGSVWRPAGVACGGEVDPGAVYEVR